MSIIITHPSVLLLEGEPIIAANASDAYEYAKDVLGERFPEGEPIIAADDYYFFQYADAVLNLSLSEAIVWRKQYLD